MKFFQLITLSLLLTISSFSFGLSNNMTNIDPGLYIAAGGGISNAFEPSLLSNKKNSNAKKITFSPAAVFNLQFGYRINRFFRADVNAQYRDIKIKSPEDIKSLKVKNYTGAINGYLDFNNALHLTPYLTAGIGFSGLDIKKNKSSTTTTSSDSHNILFNAGAGIQFQMTDYFGLDLTYRYLELRTLKVKDTEVPKSPQIGIHEVLLNFFYLF